MRCSASWPAATSAAIIWRASRRPNNEVPIDFSPDLPGWKACATALGEVRALCFDVHRVERFACGHEQTIAARPAEADVRARFGQTNHADARAVRRDDLDARPCAAPDVPVDVTADSVGG